MSAVLRAMRRPSLESAAPTSGVALLVLLVATACGGESTGSPDTGIADASSDTDATGSDTGGTDGLAFDSGTDDVDAALPDADSGDDDATDGSGASDTDGGSDAGGTFALCTSDDECEGEQCIFFDPTLEVGICSTQCFEASDCPPDARCVLEDSTSADGQRFCIPTDVCIDGDGDGWGFGNGCLGNDCDDSDDSRNFGATEVCDGVDNDCDLNPDDNPIDANQSCDTGFVGRCAEGRTACDLGLLTCIPLAPTTAEICDTLDNDCDGFIDGPVCEGERCCWTDSCVGVCGTAVRDALGVCAAPAVFGDEVCDGLDNDCDNDVDEGIATVGEACNTGALGVCGPGVVVCRGTGIECLPNEIARPETCDGVDNNCDGDTDEGLVIQLYRDADGDRFGDPLTTRNACTEEAGWVTVAGDCDDSSATTFPGAPELCDARDNDCDTVRDDGAGTSWYPDSDLDGYGVTSGAITGCVQPPGYVAQGGDCDDLRRLINPAATETCDGRDNDCDDAIDDGVATTYFRDSDGDNFGTPADTRTGCSAPAGYVLDGRDCDDTLTSVNPSAPEVCDGRDNDCDTATDEGVRLTFYLDGDFDSWGRNSVTVQACTAPSGYAARGGDCNDLEGNVSPGATELCGNSRDDDCDLATDEGC